MSKKYVPGGFRAACELLQAVQDGCPVIRGVEAEVLIRTDPYGGVRLSAVWLFDEPIRYSRIYIPAEINAFANDSILVEEFLLECNEAMKREGHTR